MADPLAHSRLAWASPPALARPQWSSTGECDAHPIPDLDISQFVIAKRVEDGAYGIVYRARDVVTDEAVAIKRNVALAGTHGIAVLREADMLTRVCGHPLIVDVRGLIFSGGDNLFAEEVRKIKSFSREDNRDDRLHFVFGLEQTDMFRATRKLPLPPHTFKLVAAQLLLAVEWIHSRGVSHRDIKPANILFNKSGAQPRIRLCDFGLSSVVAGTRMTTRGIVTSWYRPPEVCFGQSYDASVDIWSVAAVLFELMAQRALLENAKDSNTALLAEMFNSIPELATQDAVKRVAGSAFADMSSQVLRRLSPEARTALTIKSEMSAAARTQSVALRLRRLMRLSAKEAQEFNDAGGGSVEQLCALLARMLAFEAGARPNATACLADPFFACLGPYIEGMRSAYPPDSGSPKGGLPASVSGHLVTMRPSPRRRLAHAVAIELWNNRSGIKWYDHRVVFHALEVFDRYLEYIFNPRTDDATVPLTLDDKSELFLQMYTILYMFHKYFTTLDCLEEWPRFAPPGYDDADAIAVSEDFEAFIVHKVCGCQIYRATILEAVAVADGVLRESRVRECLVALNTITSVWSGTVGQLRDVLLIKK